MRKEVTEDAAAINTLFYLYPRESHSTPPSRPAAFYASRLPADPDPVATKGEWMEDGRLAAVASDACQVQEASPNPKSLASRKAGGFMRVLQHLGPFRSIREETDMNMQFFSLTSRRDLSAQLPPDASSRVLPASSYSERSPGF
ncbi:hypothetical protein EKO27_g11728 [Xylaria grammica]|uniref:Uncharacterized protein n=1 Tax=Xylaria grammica TaxID=363999 RepID=A0A439CMJ3_9PEZI|nr:hypothetical protein EKO27_g11728 [Xylaria grammica]